MQCHVFGAIYYKTTHHPKCIADIVINPGNLSYVLDLLTLYRVHNETISHGFITAITWNLYTIAKTVVATMWGPLKGGQVKGIGQSKNYEELRSVLSPYIFFTCVAVIVVVVNVVAFLRAQHHHTHNSLICLNFKSIQRVWRV